MENFVWCAIGAALGWIAGRYSASPTKVSQVEEILVGIAGAFLGSRFLVDMFWGSSEGLSFRGFVMAFLGGAATLALLMIMRRAVGPQKVSTTRRRDR